MLERKGCRTLENLDYPGSFTPGIARLYFSKVYLIVTEDTLPLFQCLVLRYLYFHGRDAS